MTVNYDDLEYANLMGVVEASVAEINRLCKEFCPGGELQRFPATIEGVLCNLTVNQMTYSFGFYLKNYDDTVVLNFRFSKSPNNFFGGFFYVKMRLDEDAHITQMIFNWMQFVKNAFDMRGLT